jgi:hypothetical protein
MKRKANGEPRSRLSIAAFEKDHSSEKKLRTLVFLLSEGETNTL